MFIPPEKESTKPAQVDSFTHITLPMCFYTHTDKKNLRRLFAPKWYQRVASFFRRLFHS
jgi:hypothetical protein